MFKLLRSVFEIPLDIYVAVGLVAIVLIVALIKWVGILPKKSLPFVFAALLGAFGYSVFQKWRSRGLSEELKKREKEIKEKEKKLKELKKQADASETKLRKVQDKLRKERAALEKQILMIEEKNEKEKDRIDNLPIDDVFKEFDQAFGGQDT